MKAVLQANDIGLGTLIASAQPPRRQTAGFFRRMQYGGCFASELFQGGLGGGRVSLQSR